MSRITEVNSGLRSILLLSRISRVYTDKICGTATFDGRGAFTLIEASAQLGAFHVRWRDEFRRQAFLIKVGECIFWDPLPAAGSFDLAGDLTGESDRSFVYRLCARKGGRMVMDGEFWFSTVEYDEKFDGARLRTHYKGLFSCLTNVSGIA
ncbi:MAG: hypothetical protein WCX84_06315 [Syntrophales bacterium]|jgi:hypothetical protein|nr:hypothetical protein [Syntrophales bacterium]